MNLLIWKEKQKVSCENLLIFMTVGRRALVGKKFRRNKGRICCIIPLMSNPRLTSYSSCPKAKMHAICFTLRRAKICHGISTTFYMTLAIVAIVLISAWLFWKNRKFIMQKAIKNQISFPWKLLAISCFRRFTQANPLGESCCWQRK